MANVATNQKYYDLFNSYMETHDLDDARTDGWLKVDQQIVPINYDMFFGFLVDKIVLSVINDHSFIDKLDGLYGKNIEYGAVIENNMTVLKSNMFSFDTQSFETDVSNPFKKSKKGLMVTYHHIDPAHDYRKIRVTVSYDQLKTGCMSDNGVDGIVRNMLNDVRVEYSGWAYYEKKKALCQRNYVQVVTFKDYADFNIKLKDVKIDVTNYKDSWKHNATLLFTPTDESNLAIIMSERFKNKVDVNVFTGLFNVSYAELKDRIIYIDQFDDDPDIVCGIYDKRGFEFHRILDTTRQLENGEDLSRNSFTHFWRMHSVDHKYTAVVFKEEKEDVLDDVSMLVKGYKDDNTGFTASTTITAPFDCKVTINGSSSTYAKDATITITNPQTIAPVTAIMTKQEVTSEVVDGETVETRTDIASCLYRIRFEYPSNIDATLGHPRNM